jgi:hypothetical protein
MSFVTALALTAVVFVAAPLIAHMLRRKVAEEQPFSAVHLVPPTPPEAKRKSRVEDRALFAVRALAVLALALLGATPLVRCDRVSLTRNAGASVALAIVLDDSLSMRAPLADGGPSRFERARDAALDLVAGADEGDAIAVVLAGSPPRVALAATTSLATATATLKAATPSDRATDLDAALALAVGLVDELPQSDRRVVLLSDLADGHGGAPLPTSANVRVWTPLPELLAQGDDCGVTQADLAGSKVRARVVCSEGTSNQERTLELRTGDEVVSSAPFTPRAGPTEVLLDAGSRGAAELDVVLSAGDAIETDDRAPVLPPGGALSIAVITDAASSRVATGGSPPVEQALDALGLAGETHPLPAVPEHPKDLDAYGALLLDDAPGLTPEVRRALAAWIERGNVALVTLGPRAASAPLGAGFERLVPGVVRWSPSPVRGVELASAGFFGSAADGLVDLSPEGRATVAPEVTEDALVHARWSDGAPLLVERKLGRGTLFVSTLPFSVETSDLVLRPAFLTLLERVVAAARSRGGARRVETGDAWTFASDVVVRAERLPTRTNEPPTPIAIETLGTKQRAVAGLAGRYAIAEGDSVSKRVAAVPERELDLTPRALPEAAAAAELGGDRASIDISAEVALALLALLAAETLLRLLAARRAPARTESAPG